MADQFLAGPWYIVTAAPVRGYVFANSPHHVQVSLGNCEADLGRAAHLRRPAALGPTLPRLAVALERACCAGMCLQLLRRRGISCRGVAVRDPGVSLRWRLGPGAPLVLRTLPWVDLPWRWPMRA